MLLGEQLDGAGNLISGADGDMRQLHELPRISALRFGFPACVCDAPLATFAAAARFRLFDAEQVKSSTRDGRHRRTCWKNESLEKRFTKLQGQYLAFIVAYAKLNRRPPAEADFQRFFEVTPPSVHNMIVTLDRLGLIKRTPRRPRSIELLVPLSEIPSLD